MTRYRFFAGKGGVGKTTCAAATAARLAAARRRVLLVSLDPAHSLGDALARRLGRRPVAVDGRPGRLHAVELDADRALARWLAPRRPGLQTIAERGTYLDREDVARLLELSMPGVDELVGLVELARVAGVDRYDDVIVDTAPTGHTLRLLAMPATLRRIAGILADMHAKHRFLAESLGRRYRPDRADALVDEIDAEGRALQALLTDAARCGITWVLRPEVLALEESLDGVAALDAAGLAVTALVLNGVAARAGGRCAPCAARAAAEDEVLRALAVAFPRRPLCTVPALATEPRGLSALRGLARRMVGGVPLRRRASGRLRPAAAPPSGPPSWLPAVAPPDLRLVLVGGKGGVGKTTCAAALALALGGAAPERRVLLLSTDPAHSLGDVLQAPLDDEARPVAGAPTGLRARELDAAHAFRVRRARYRAAVDELFTALVRGARFDVAFDRAVMAELIDLAPPGLDELFAVLAVVEALGAGGGPAAYDVVVVDTAPTGHALRLLAMPAVALEWVHALLAILLKYRAVLGLGAAADLLGLARDLRALDALLHDPARARFVTVTRAAALPLLETGRLLARLRRMRVPAGALVVNAVTRGDCLRCRRARAAERRVLLGLPRREGGVRLLAPSQWPPPRGVAALSGWAHAWEREVA